MNVADLIDSGQDILYPDGPRLVAEAADKMNITGKMVLVIGTEVPWVETILLQRKPRSGKLNKSYWLRCFLFRKGVTVEYMKMKR